MFKEMKKRLGNEKGLTLIELLAVIVILAIIAAIAIPAVGSIIEKQKDKAVLGDAARIINSAKLAHADGACTKDECTDKDLENYLEMQTEKEFVGTVTKGEKDWTLNWTNDYVFKKITGVVLSNATEKQILKAMGNTSVKETSPTTGGTNPDPGTGD